MNSFFVVDATLIMLATFLYAIFKGHEPDKPTTIIPATILFSYAFIYFIVGKYYFGIIEFITGLGWIGIYFLFTKESK
jgi:hypothetical protein